MPVTPKQADRQFAVKTPLGTDELLFYRMTVREELSQPFHYELKLLSENASVKVDDILGQPVTIEMKTAHGEALRYFHGHVTRFTQVRSHSPKLSAYEMTVRPWLWFLTRTADCQIFQAMKVPDIIQKIFKDQNGFTDYRLSLSATYREWDYCVQYRETDFAFVSRLMEQEGIYYYFEHEDGKHTLVLCDALGAHKPVQGREEEIIYLPPDSRREPCVYDWTLSHEVQPGSTVLRDFDFEAPKKNLETKQQVSYKHPQGKGEVFDYPGEYTEASDGQQYAKVRIQESQAQHEIVRGTSDVDELATGYLFKLKEFPRDDQNREYLLVSTEIELASTLYETGPGAAGTEPYTCRLTAIPSAQPFRPPRRTSLPYVRGPQTAIVVGKSGEEIWTDKYGRVKVQFHWDRLGKKDENSSCWVRVAQLWAGKTWGGIHIPRIGQEVIVEFMEGDPDRPIITGRVYNADEMPPYALPDNQTQSGIKSRSTKQGDTKTFNELRFEDKKDSEEVYFHAEKNFNRVVENDDTLKVGFDKKDKGDQSVEIHNNQTTKIGTSGCDDGSQTYEVWKDQNVKIGVGSSQGSQTVQIYKDRTTTLDTGNEKLQVKQGNREVLVDTGNDTHTVKTGNRTVEIKTGNDAVTVKTGNRSIKVSLGKIAEEAMQSIELKVGSNSIKIDQTGVTIKGLMVKIEGTTMLEGKSPMTTVKGDGMLTLKGGVTMIN